MNLAERDEHIAKWIELVSSKGAQPAQVFQGRSRHGLALAALVRAVGER